MDMPEKHPKQGEQQHTYIVDPESAAEMARLLHQDRAVNEAEGGVLTERSDHENIHRVLDIGCGPGGWVLQVARTYPHMKVTGIDISRLMINFASTQATREGLRNAKFEVMNALEPLEFPDNTFDLVNMRFAVGYILRKDWPRVMRECFRITAPGGSLRLTETDHSGITNSAAFTKVNNLLCGMTHKAGYGFSEDGSTFCLTPMFEQLLTEAGFTNVKYRPYIIDISYGKPMLAAHWRNMRTIFVNSGILLEKLKLGTREEVERIHAAAEEAISQESFRGLVYVLNAWGQKPFLA